MMSLLTMPSFILLLAAQNHIAWATTSSNISTNLTLRRSRNVEYSYPTMLLLKTAEPYAIVLCPLILGNLSTAAHILSVGPTSPCRIGDLIDLLLISEKY